MWPPSRTTVKRRELLDRIDDGATQRHGSLAVA